MGRRLPRTAAPPSKFALILRLGLQGGGHSGYGFFHMNTFLSQTLGTHVQPTIDTIRAAMDRHRHTLTPVAHRNQHDGKMAVR